MLFLPILGKHLAPNESLRQNCAQMNIPPLIDTALTLSDDEMRRYSRQTVIPDIALEGQGRLKNAKIVCVGAGGLGSPILMYLASAGVGTIGIVEFDTVDESNLQRQIIYSNSDVGKSKAVIAKKKISEINPFVKIVTHQFKLSSSNVMEIFKEYDLIIDGTDNFATRYLINDACVLLKKPLIWGSVLRFDGQASVFWSQHGPCYRCLHPTPPTDSSNCSEAGVLGVLCASIGSIQATEAIKLITGIGESLIGSLITFDALLMKFSSLKLSKDPNCIACGENPTLHTLLEDYEGFCQPPSLSEISVHELKSKMENGAEFYLVDVREPHEFEIVKIPGGELIPLTGILDGSALSKMPFDKDIIVYCRSGKRSATALVALKVAGFKRSTHVVGGVLAWAQEIDPTCTVY